MATSQKAIRDKWFELRQTIRNEIAFRKDPLLLGKLILDIVSNNSKFPVKYKWPMIHVVIEEFEKTPMSHFNSDYLGKMYHDASIRQYQGYGRKAVYLRNGFRSLLSEVENRLNNMPGLG